MVAQPLRTPPTGDRFRQLVILAIGALVYGLWRVFRPARLQACKEQLFASHSLSFLERQLVEFHLYRIGMDTRTASTYWAGAAGTRFHTNDDHRLTPEFVATDTLYRRPMLDEFAARAAQSLRPGAAIVEVGCGPGANLRYVRGRLLDRGFRFFGFDINGEVIASDQQYRAQDLQFEVKDCFGSDIKVAGDLGILFCAVLTYAREEEILRLFRQLIHDTPGRILLGVSEPTHDPDAAEPSRHNNLALLHGYRRIFVRELGLRPLFESVLHEQGKISHIYHAVFEFPR